MSNMQFMQNITLIQQNNNNTEYDSDECSSSAKFNLPPVSCYPMLSSGSDLPAVCLKRRSCHTSRLTHSILASTSPRDALLDPHPRIHQVCVFCALRKKAL